MQSELARVRPGRNRDRVRAAAEMQIGEAEKGDGNDGESEDSRNGERFGRRGLHRGSFRRSVVAPTLGRYRRRVVVARPDSASYRPTIRRRTRGGGGKPGRAVRSACEPVRL